MLLLSAPLWDHPTTVLSQPWPTTDFQQGETGHRKVWLYDKADWDSMRSFLACVEWTSLSKGHCADLAWVCVKDNLGDAMDFYIAAKQTSHCYSDKPWFDELCREAIQ